jgi:hypothetical protein
MGSTSKSTLVSYQLKISNYTVQASTDTEDIQRGNINSCLIVAASLKQSKGPELITVCIYGQCTTETETESWSACKHHCSVAAKRKVVTQNMKTSEFWVLAQSTYTSWSNVSRISLIRDQRHSYYQM